MLSFHTYHYNNLIIGSTLPAILYSYFNQIPIIYNKIEAPFMFEYYEKDYKLDFLYFKIYVMYTLIVYKNNPINFYFFKYDIYERLLYLLSMSGYVPFENKIKTITIEKNKLLTIVLKSGKNIKVTYDNLIIFNDWMLTGLPEPKKENDNYVVADWIDTKQSDEQELDLIEDKKNNFVNKLYLYPTGRLKNNWSRKKKSSKLAFYKDLVAVSYLTKEQIESEDYSQNIVRLKALKMMNKAGCLGKKRMEHNKTTGEIYRRPLKIVPVERNFRLIKQNEYDNIENIEFIYDTDMELIEKYKDGLDFTNNVHRLNNALYGGLEWKKIYSKEKTSKDELKEKYRKIREILG